MTSTPSENRMGLDEVKRLQGLLYEFAKRCEDQASRVQKVTDLFTSDALFLRTKVQDYADRLFLADPLKSGEKAVELYWRKGIYDIFVKARILKDQWSPFEKAYIQSHLLAGYGHFLTFLAFTVKEVESKPKIFEALHLEKIDFVQTQSYGSSFESESGSITNNNKWHDSEALKGWAKLIIHKCLMYLGDLSRYLCEFSPKYASISERYYHMALMIDPQIGNPLNQLATLNANLDYGLSSAFFYLKSMFCSKPFPGAEANLRKLLEKNGKVFAKYALNLENELKVLSHKEEKERCVTFFLEMVNHFLFEDKPVQNSSQLCKITLECVQHCLYIAIEDFSASQKLLPDSVATNMVSAIILVMHRLEGKAAHLSMLKAYLLAMFSHFVTKYLADMYLDLFGPESMMEMFDKGMEEVEDEKTDETSEQINKTEIIEEKASKNKKRKGLDRFKRRRRGSSSSSSEVESEGFSSSSEIKSEIDSELSGEDEDDLSLSDNNDVLDSDTSSGNEEDDDDDDDVIIESTKEILSMENVVKLVRHHHLNGALRICSLWLMQRPDLAKEIGSSCKVLCFRLAKLFNTLDVRYNSQYDKNDEVLSKFNEYDGEIDSVPLPEDTTFLGVHILKGFSEKKSEKVRKIDSDSLDLGVLRILHLLKLRKWLCDRKILYEKQDGLVAVATSDILGNEKEILEIQDSEAKQDVPESDSVDESKEKLKLMENMAQLWLEQEVKDLEGKTRSSGFKMLSNYSPFLVIDHKAMSKHLHLVKEIVASRKFAIIIPTEVIQLLDDIKKEVNGARAAIKWLEMQFKDGNQWLRAQKSHESKELEPEDEETLGKCKTRSHKQMTGILRCCCHFASLRSSEETRKFNVTLLTSADDEAPDETNSTETATESISAEKIKEFAEKNHIAFAFITDFFQPSKKKHWSGNKLKQFRNKRNAQKKS